MLCVCEWLCVVERHRVYTPHPFSSSSLLQDKVLAEFSKSADESGMDIKDVIKAMESQGVNGAQVREAVEYLAGEGHLYSTIDEEHFKSTAC